MSQCDNPVWWYIHRWWSIIPWPVSKSVENGGIGNCMISQHSTTFIPMIHGIKARIHIYENYTIPSTANIECSRNHSACGLVAPGFQYGCPTGTYTISLAIIVTVQQKGPRLQSTVLIDTLWKEWDDELHPINLFIGPSEENYTQRGKYIRWFHNTKTTVFTLISAIRRAASLHISSTIITEGRLWG